MKLPPNALFRPQTHQRYTPLTHEEPYLFLESVGQECPKGSYYSSYYITNVLYFTWLVIVSTS